jgi:glycosyltransferase involved in cell wall biosynthesis
MPGRVALLTSLSLRQPSGGALRVLQQARGLWRIGFREFTVFSPEPDPDQPFDQDVIMVWGPAQFALKRRTGCTLVHAHQNAGLFLKERFWADLHGFAPLESRAGWLAHPASPRAMALCALSQWATPRLIRRAGRVLCASQSIADRIERFYQAGKNQNGGTPSLEVIRNGLELENFAPTACREACVGVIGGFTSRWGRPAFHLALEVARLCPELPFRLVGSISDGQRSLASDLPNVEALGLVDEPGYHAFLQSVSMALMPYPEWCVGGGSRLKLLEACASGLAVVSTPAGLEGFEAPEEALVGRTPQELADHLLNTLANSEDRQRRGLALRRHVAEHHDSCREAQRLAELYDGGLRRS